MFPDTIVKHIDGEFKLTITLMIFLILLFESSIQSTPNNYEVNFYIFIVFWLSTYIYFAGLKVNRKFYNGKVLKWITTTFRFNYVLMIIIIIFYSIPAIGPRYDKDILKNPLLTLSLQLVVTGIPILIWLLLFFSSNRRRIRNETSTA